MLRFLTAGESHGQFLLGILEGMPAGLKIDKVFINRELKLRQLGMGRGKRMQIESDRIFAITGLKSAKTIGAPIGLIIKNRDAKIESLPQVLIPRPGHADLAGVLKYGFKDCRLVLERASARETAMRVAIGAVCKLLLNEFKIKINSRVLHIAGQTSQAQIKKIIELARKNKDTLGGVFQLEVRNCLPGLGSYVHYDRRLDARLAAAIMSIPAIKAAEIGMGVEASTKFGSQVHDAIYFSAGRFCRKTNRAGGIEGGVSNGEPIILRAAMKPIATLGCALDSVNLVTKKKAAAAIERFDTCALESAAAIAQSMTAFVLAQAFLEKFGADSLEDIKVNVASYRKRIGW